MKSNITTRFAPSPTGTLHAGSYRTAIFSYLYAKKNGGKFILRIEDTDTIRSTKEFEKNIIDSLEWLGIKYDEFYRQSECVNRHTFYLQKMLDEGTAYISKEEVKKEGDRKEVIRFKNPNRTLSFEDMIRGTISFDTTELGDFVIAKSLTEPLFHLAVVVDDFSMGVTDIIRGEDHIPNTPRQLLLGEAIGAPVPRYAHLPMVLGTDRSKLSKRKGARALSDYKTLGYLPQALLNYISLVGWNPGGEQEIFTEDELIALFDLGKVHKAGAIFDEVKLNWVNKEHLKKLSLEEITASIIERLPVYIKEYDTFNARINKIIPLIKERISYYGEIDLMVEQGELDYFFKAPQITLTDILPPEKMRKGIEVTEESTREILRDIYQLLYLLNDEEFTKERVREIIFPYADKQGRGIVLWPLRYLLSGKEKSPDPFELCGILGKQETLSRLEHIIK